MDADRLASRRFEIVDLDHRFPWKTSVEWTAVIYHGNALLDFMLANHLRDSNFLGSETKRSCHEIRSEILCAADAC